ncbi:hypothetical protein ABK040_009765 [Willaertia magna]
MFSFEEEQNDQQQQVTTTIDDNNQTNKQQQEEFSIHQNDEQQQQINKQTQQQSTTYIDTIDIHYEKIKDWLINRSILTQDYVKQLSQLRAYMKQAYIELINKNKEQYSEEREKKITDFLENSIKKKALTLQVEGYEVFDYFLTKELTSLLEKADANEGSGFLFGLVGGSKRLKLWKYILQLYESKGLYFAEISNEMIQQVKYEIPSIYNTILKNKNVLESLDRKEEDWKKALDQTKKEFMEECKKLSIPIENIEILLKEKANNEKLEEEIKNQTKELFVIYNELISLCKTSEMKKIFEFYNQFVEFISNYGKKESHQLNNLLKCLEFILKQEDKKDGSVSCNLYDWKVFNNEKFNVQIDESLVKEYMNKMIEEENKKNKKQEDEPTIDFGEDTIDFGDKDLEIQWDANIEESKELEIKFDDVEQTKELEIDFGDFEIPKEEEVSSTVNKEEEMKNIAKMKLESFLNDDDVRSQFLDEVNLLNAFVLQRIVECEMNVEIDNELFRNAPVLIRNITKDELVKISNITKKLTSNTRLQQLALIKNSKKYVERLVQTLSQKLEIITKLQSNLEGLVDQRKSLQLLIEKEKPVAEGLKNVAKEYQTFLQDAIAKKLGGNKKINIFGEINKM